MSLSSVQNHSIKDISQYSLHHVVATRRPTIQQKTLGKENEEETEASQSGVAVSSSVMKTSLEDWNTALRLLATCVVLISSEEIDEYEYEDDGAAAAPQPPSPPQPAQRGRSSLLAPRNKASPLASNANKINKQSGVGGKAAPAAKAAPAPAVQETPEEEVADYDQAQEEPVEQTSTEAPKKTIKPIVRPFRSNDDLLAALKRRRQQVQNHGGVADKTSTTTSTTTAGTPSKKSSNSFGSNGKRNRNGGGRSAVGQSPQDEYVPEADHAKKPSQSRKYNSRGNSRSAPAPPPVVEDVPIEEAPKPKFGRGSRRPV